MRQPLLVLVLGLGLGCGGVQGPAGATGPAGADYIPTPVLVRLQPTTAELGQSALSVEITGAGTHFTQDSTTVTFDDPGITAPAVQVNSPGALVAQVSIATSTKIGVHNLTVTTPGAGLKGAAETESITGIFTIGSLLTGVSGGIDAMTQPGALFHFSVTNPDATERPFQGEPALTTARILNFTAAPGALSGLALVDALVPAGPMPLTVLFTSGAQVLSYGMAATDPTVPTVTAHAPKALTLGTTLVGEDFAAGADPTNLYQFTTTANNQVLVATVVSTGGGLVGSGVYGVTAPPSGHFDQFFTTSRGANSTLTGLAYLPTLGTQYMALLPGQFTGTSGMDYALTVKAATGTRFSSSEHGTPDSQFAPVAQVTLNAPAFSQDGVINYTGDVDYILITTPKAGNLYVFAGLSDLGATNITYTPQPPLVTLYAADCATILLSATLAQQQTAVTAGTTYCAAVAHQGTVLAPIPYQLVISQDL